MINNDNVNLLTKEELKCIANLVSIRRSACIYDLNYKDTNSSVAESEKHISRKNIQEELDNCNSILCKLLCAGDEEKFTWLTSKLAYMPYELVPDNKELKDENN